MDDPSLWTLVLLGLAGLLAGWVDAVVGGGGLVQLPALVIGLPGASPVQILATNKPRVGLRYDGQLDDLLPEGPAGPADLRAADGAGVLRLGRGAVVASSIPKQAFYPIILVVLVLVGAYTLLRPSIGHVTELRFAGHHHTLAAMVAGAVIGFYDGALGPGTGSFFVFALVGLLGYGLPRGLREGPDRELGHERRGAVRLHPAGRGAVEDRARRRGCEPGRRLPRRAHGGGPGRRFVRVVFIGVVGAFTLKIGYDVVRAWLG